MVGDYEGHPVLFFTGAARTAQTITGPFAPVAGTTPLVYEPGVRFWITDSKRP